MKGQKTLSIFLCALFLLPTILLAEWSGNISSRVSAYKNQALLDNQERVYSSLAIQPAYFKTWDNDRQLFDLELFVRMNDSVPNTADIREFSWEYSERKWEFKAGIRKVFWGVTESQHLVDIINQTDFRESFDGEAKLGQPMLNLVVIQNWGTLDLFVLTGFRERKYPDDNARLRFPLPVTDDPAKFESGAEEKNIDYALRWSHYLGDWDFALSHFYGTNREPRFQRYGNQFIPMYDIINQTGVEVQATIENWLWKLEAIRRDGAGSSYFASTSGFEYTFFDINSSGIDVGIVAEYSYDERGKRATTPFQNDTMLGVRLALNDEQSTDALIGAIVDNDGEGVILSLEASRRIGHSFKLTINGYLFTESSPGEFMYAYSNEDFVEVEFGYYF